MDDDFMTVCLADNFEGVELILRIVLGREDIKIKAIRIQEPLKNLQGRSAVLDVHAVDSTDKEFDVEIQRKDAGAGAKRARHNSSLLDAHILKPGDYDEKGVAAMCKMMEDMRNEAAQQAEQNKAKKMAVRMIKAGKMPLEDIADYTEFNCTHFIVRYEKTPGAKSSSCQPGFFLFCSSINAFAFLLSQRAKFGCFLLALRVHCRIQ